MILMPSVVVIFPCFYIREHTGSANNVLLNTVVLVVLLVLQGKGGFAIILIKDMHGKIFNTKNVEAPAFLTRVNFFFFFFFCEL